MLEFSISYYFISDVMAICTELHVTIDGAERSA